MSYTQDNIVSPGQPPLLWSDIDSAFRVINQNFVELYATIGGGSVVDFSNLSTNVSPSATEIYDLGAPTRRWKDLYLSGSSLYLGDAVITATGTSVNLPAGSTIAGSVLDNEYFKTIAVAGQSDIVADAGGEDTLTLVAGNAGITLTTNATTDTLTITNSGVISAVASTGISVSAATGNITLTNTGVTGLTAGQGVSLNAGTGAVTITNSGLIGIDPGIGITVSPRDPVTGLVTVTNSQPNIPQNVFNTIAVPTQSDIAADSTTDTLTIQSSGNGLSITTNSSTDTITFANTGVHSLAVGNGLTASAGTGSINLTLDATLTRNIIGDIVGSVFADDSAKLVDAVEAKIVGDIDTASLRTSEEQIRIGLEAGLINQGAGSIAIGARAGRSQGNTSVAIGQDAGKNQFENNVAIGVGAGENGQLIGATAVGAFAGYSVQAERSTAIGYNAAYEFQGEGTVAVGYRAGRSFQAQQAVAVGEEAGQTSQALRATAIGFRAGQTTQGTQATAIGNLAGSFQQGQFAVAIGASAGLINQPANSIVINASGVQLDGSAAGFFVDPVRSSTTSSRPVVYNTTTKELLYTSTLEFINSTISTSDSSGITVDVFATFNSDVIVENDLTVAERLTVKGGRVINLTELKAVVAASVDFADFQTRIAALT